MCCSHDGCAMRCLNFYHLRFAQSTIFQVLCQGASSSSVTYQCVLHVVDWSCADKCTMCMAHNIIACLYWENYHFVGIPSFPLSRLNDVGNIVGRFWQLWTVTSRESLTRLSQPVWPSDLWMAYFQLRCTHYWTNGLAHCKRSTP